MNLETKFHFAEQAMRLRVGNHLEQTKPAPDAELHTAFRKFEFDRRHILMPEVELPEEWREKRAETVAEYEWEWEQLLVLGRYFRDRMRADPAVVPVLLFSPDEPAHSRMPPPFFAELALAALAASERP